MVTEIVRNYHYTPPAGYEFAGKTGTSDDNRNTYYIGYSPEVVTGVWVGNNDNSKMTYMASGWMSARPIWIDYTNKIIGRFSPTKFTRPGGIVTATVCNDSGLISDGNCEEITDLFIQDKLPQKDDSHEVYRVCKDQPRRLARDIDEKLGFAVDKVFSYIKAPKEEWQVYWDEIFNQNEPPTEYCTKDRNPSGSKKPWVEIDKPSDGEQVNQGDSLKIKATAYSSLYDITEIEIYIGSTYITKATNNPYVGSITVPMGIASGYYDLIIKAYDDSGRSGSSSVNILVGDTVSITLPSNGSEFNNWWEPIKIEAVHFGSSGVISAQVNINGMIDTMDLEDEKYVYSWSPGAFDTYNIEVTLNLSDGTSVNSQVVTVDVQPI